MAFITEKEWEKIEKKKQDIKIIFPVPYKEYSKIQNMNKIFPAKQREVYNIVENLKNNKLIKKIIIFGSSITPNADFYSDLDIALELNIEKFNEEDLILNDISRTISKITKGNFDLLFINDPDIYNSEIYDNIQKGVIVYNV